MKSKGDCKIECGNGYHPARLGSRHRSTIAECEQECSLGSTPNFGYAPENSGRIAWDSSKQPNGGWSATCTTVVCNEGYDDNDDDNTCEKTEAGYYSAGQNRKTRTQCTLDGNTNQAKPKDDASWQGTGLVNAVACRWTCNSGHHISSDSTSCTINDCSSEINDGAGERTSHSGACQVTSCEAGFYEKTTGTCSEVRVGSGKYSAISSKTVIECATALSTSENTFTLSDNAHWTNIAGASSSSHCTWACNSGWVQSGNTCIAPLIGSYADANGDSKSCLAKPSGSSWKLKVTVGGLVSVKACNFDCPLSHPIKTNTELSRACEALNPGEYEVEGTKHSCGGGQALTERGATNWAVSQSGVKKASACKIAGCTEAGKVLNSDKIGCVNLSTGSYKDSTTHEAVSCGTAPNHGTWALSQVGVTEQSDCVFTCSTGRTPSGTGDNSTCELSTQDCSPANAPANSGTQTWDENKQPNAGWDLCQVNVCSAGFDDNNENNRCEKTAPDYYSASKDKTRKDCTGNPVHSQWVANETLGSRGASTYAECKWACINAYTKGSDNLCHETTIACTANDKRGRNIAAGTKTYTTGSGYGICDPQTCLAGFVLASNVCRPPNRGFYSKSGVETTCKDIPNKQAWLDNPARGLASDNCDFTCAGGFVKDGRACYESPQTRAFTVTENSVQKTLGQESRTYTAGTGYGAWSITSCIAGYDSTQDSTQCQKTESGYYSPAGNHQRISCKKPDDSSWTTATGLTSELDCFIYAWRCDAGYDNQENGHLCEATIARHYSPAGNNSRRSCTRPDNSSWTTTTGLTSMDDCATQAWRCDAGYDNQENSTRCEATITGHYSPAESNTRTACTKPNDSSWTTTTGLTSVEDCATQAWRCNAGYDNQENSTRCEATITGHYSPAESNIRTACTKLNNSSWTTTTGLTSVEDCATQAWRCDAGYDNQEDSKLCQATIARHYSPAGSNTRTACTKSNDSSWTTTTGLTSVKDCATQAWRCNAGYDDHNDTGACSVTDATYYSSAGSSDRIACNTVTVPNDATADPTSTGLSSANQCWTCDAGYDDHDDDGTCSVTDAGHYSSAGSSDRTACNTVTVPNDATADPTSTGLSSANQCWTCNAGYDDHDDDGTCSVTDAGHYSPVGNSERISCTVPDDATVDLTIAGLSSDANQCWTCNAGYDDHDDDGICSVTNAGHYSPAGSSDRTACNTVTVPDDATADSASTGLSSANQCWTCNAGYDDHDNDGTCSVTDAGHYSPAGSSDRISCNTVTNPDDATADSASTGLSSANQCWTCDAGYDDHDDDGTCSVTDAGHYSPAGSSDRIACNTVTVPYDATADSASTGLSSANQCWTCNAGYDDHDDDGTCSVTDAGHYSPAGNSDRISCTVPDDATADLTITGLSSDANQCWTCNAGYDDHNDDGTCSVTDAGHYSPAGNSDRISCNTVTNPDDATADSASTGLSSANQCWTCNAGYVRAGNICVRKITAFVTGYKHTCALLEDKSVECWGRRPRIAMAKRQPPA